MQSLDRGIEPATAIERAARPRMGEVAKFGHRPAGGPQPIDGARVEPTEPRPAGPPQRAANAFRRIRERILQPAVEGALVQRGRLRVGEDREQRIDPRLDRPLTEQLRAEPMNGVDVRFFERLQRFFQAAAFGLD